MAAVIEKKKTISVPTLKRLPDYCHYLESLIKNGVKTVSATDIAKALHQVPIQVRKDLAVTSIAGKPKIGYETEQLLEALEKVLGWKNLDEAVIVGCGNLGRALLGYEGFKKYGFDIVLAFDKDKNKIGSKINGIEIFPMERMINIIQRMHLEIGIITVPAEEAQKTADILIDSGIKALWNFAPTLIRAPKEIIIQNENMASSLAIMSSKLSDLPIAEDFSNKLKKNTTIQKEV